MSAPSPTYVIVPIKDPASGKSRLSPVLDAAQRHALCLYLAKRTLTACVEAFGAPRTIVVTASAEILQLVARTGIRVVAEKPVDDGLNSAIAAGIAFAQSEKAGSVLVVPADLALVSVAELRAAAEAIPAAPGCLIVPDRRHTGTNALGFSPPRTDVLSFGDMSLQRHARQAALAGCEVRVLASPALGLDLDFPEDYAAWRREAPGIAAEAVGYPEQAGSISA